MFSRVYTVPYDREYLQNELKWLFKKRRDEVGVYFDFKPLRSSSVIVSLEEDVLQHMFYMNFCLSFCCSTCQL